jgi:hypothetical protein
MRCIWALVALVLASASAVADEPERREEAPRIESVRIGIANHFKVGHWTPVRVVFDGGGLNEPRVDVIVPDSDGVRTIATAETQASDNAGEKREAIAYTVVGRRKSPIVVALAESDERIESLTLLPGAESGASGRPVGSPATSEVLLLLSSSGFQLKDAYKEQLAADADSMKRVVNVEHAAELPREWFGYDGFDVIVLAVDDGPLWRELTSDDAKVRAIAEWVAMGGRLVLMCGGESAPAAFGEGKGLASLLPGKFLEVVRLPETGRLEHFANSEVSIGGGGGRRALMVPRLTDVVGKIEVYSGQRSTDLPILVRSPRGFGEIAFVGLDFNKAPLADWPGRTAFLQALLEPYVTNDEMRSASQTLVSRGYNDISGALRQSMGRLFPGVAPVSFSTVALLAVLYLLVLGPIDYFIVHRWLRRPVAAWVTFPLIVLAFGGGALAISEWRRGGETARVNRREVVDFEGTSKLVRGTYWATLYEPRAIKLSPRFAPANVGAEREPQVLLSAWGLPGTGIGGMQSGGMDLGIVRDAYRYEADRDELVDVPVLTSATKSFVARWVTAAAPPIAATLKDVGGLVAGTVENRTDKNFRNVRLFYNGWGYSVGTLAAGQQKEVGEELSPLRVKTMVARSAFGKAAATLAEGTVYHPDDASPEAVLNLMMFFDAAGGRGFAQLPNRFQADVDLSRLLDLGRAIVVAEVDDGGSRLVEGESDEEIGEADSSDVVYRVVFPVRKEE